MRYADYYASSQHPRRSAQVRRIGTDDIHLTRIRQRAHSLDDPPTDELVVGVVLGGTTRCRWTWGDGWNLTEGRRAGDIGLTPPGSGGTFEVDGDHELLVIGFPLRMLSQRGLVDDMMPRTFGRLHDAYHRDATVFGLCLRLWTLAGSPGQTSEMESDTITAGLMARWQNLSTADQGAARPVRPLDPAVVSAIRARIMAAPAASHRLSDWARLAGMTASAFCRAFKASVGIPPHRYLLLERLDLADQMLAMPHSDIDGIAETLGFDSRSHFNRVYARLRGRTPRDPI